MLKSAIIAQMDYIQWIENSKRVDFAFDMFQKNPISSSFCIDTSSLSFDWLHQLLVLRYVTWRPFLPPFLFIYKETQCLSHCFVLY